MYHFEWDENKNQLNQRIEKPANKRQTIMQKEYDLTQLKVKRRGLLADLPPNDNSPAQMAVSLLLDKGVIGFFQKAAAQPNALPYQVQIKKFYVKLLITWKVAIRDVQRVLGS